jgi:hypothetical protein
MTLALSLFSVLAAASFSFTGSTTVNKHSGPPPNLCLLDGLLYSVGARVDIEKRPFYCHENGIWGNREPAHSGEPKQSLPKPEYFCYEKNEAYSHGKKITRGHKDFLCTPEGRWAEISGSRIAGNRGNSANKRQH